MVSEDFAGMVQIVRGDTLKVNDETTFSFSAENLEPVPVFSANARFYMDGELQDSLPPPAVFQGKDDPSIMVTLDEVGNLERASIVDTTTGVPMSLIPAGAEGTFVTVSEVRFLYFIWLQVLMTMLFDVKIVRLHPSRTRIYIYIYIYILFICRSVSFLFATMFCGYYLH